MFYFYSLMRQIIMTASSNPDLAQGTSKQDVQSAADKVTTETEEKFTGTDYFKDLKEFLDFASYIIERKALLDAFFSAICEKTINAELLHGNERSENLSLKCSEIIHEFVSLVKFKKPLKHSDIKVKFDEVVQKIIVECKNFGLLFISEKFVSDFFDQHDPLRDSSDVNK